MNYPLDISKTRGDNTYEFVPLPVEAQVAPVFAILVADVDGDDNEDILLGGNFKGTRVKFGEYDASYGTVLKGDGQGGFVPLSVDESGLWVKGEVRDIVKVAASNGGELLLWARNNDGIVVFKLAKEST